MPSVVTALNADHRIHPGGRGWSREALKRNLAIRDVAVEKPPRGALKHRDQDRPVSVAEVRLRWMTCAS